MSDDNKIFLKGVPQAYSFVICDCGAPGCGPHIVAVDPNNVPVIQIAVPIGSTLSVIKALQGILYKKAVESESDGNEQKDV